MTPLASSSIRRTRRRGALRRVLRAALYVKLGLAVVLGFACGLLYLRLSTGPMSVAGLSERVADALAARIGPDWTVDVGKSELDLDDGSLALRAIDLDIRDPSGALVVRAPRALVSVGTGALLTGSLQPRAVEFQGLQLTARIDRAGTISFLPPDAPGETVQAVPEPPTPTPNPAEPGSRIAAALESLFDLLVHPRGIVGALDQARLTDARLVIVDEARQERARFDRVAGTFTRREAGRTFDLQLQGPNGAWRLSGEIRADDARREGSLAAADVPAADLLLLAGLSALPGSTDLKLTGEAKAAVVAGRLARFDATVSAGAGSVRFTDEAIPAIHVEAVGARAAWDEARRALVLDGLAFRGEGTDLRLSGSFEAPHGDAWRLELAGRDGTIGGLTAKDRPIPVADLSAVLTGRDGGVAVERLAVRGPALDVAVDAAYGGSADPGALRVSARALGTDVRTALRLWPAPVVPLLRRHLADNALGGTVDAVGVEVALTGAEMTDVLAGRPTPDSAVRAEYVISGGVLTVVEGLPPLSRLDLSGTATGTKVDIVAHGAEVRMADGRALTLPGGTLRVPNVWAADSTAHIATRLQGGADALASLLRAPLLKEMAGIELDPANAKGRVDLRLTLPLPLNPIPPIDDMPLSIAGTIDGLAVDKAVGSDRLEDANLTVAYDRGSLAIKGEGRLAGSPATVEVRQPRGEPGEAVVAFGLDEAGRTRRGLSFGSQLTGPVAVRIVQPLGRAGAPARVEADLTRAALDNLVPGWTKPAGRPGKLSFTVAEGSPELRDVALDSGPVQARGTAVLSNDGQLDRLDLSSLKLSPNDQMRVLLERQGPLRRVTIRGAAVDARPFVKGLTGPSGGVKDASDLEIDLALGVITGFNDESLTNPAAKIAIRGRDVRQVTLAARMRGSPLTASLERTGGGPAVLDIQSGNAGATLRFLDIYRRMAGGILSLQVTMGQEPQRGRIWIDSFSLRDEPAMARLAATAPASNGVDDAARVSLPQIDTKDVPFQRLRAEFQRSETRLDFRDAVMSGPNVGFTAGGWIDYGRDRTDISGTFVPAFGLNNAFNQVPLIGLFLGGRDEGLFAVNFRISGPASAPALSVNPLSAVAPGFLRKLFGVGGDSATVQGVPAPRAP